MKHTETIRDILQRAESGDPFAQTLIGFLLEIGLSGNEDPKGAGKWYEYAAIQDFLPGQYALARLLLADDEQREVGVEWLSRSAGAGYAASQFALATLYLEGKFVGQDLDLAMHWMQASADQGYPLALLRLSLVFKDGVGVDVNAERALDCLRQAAEAGETRAAFMYGTYLLKQNTKNRDDGLRWIWFAAKRNHFHANMFLEKMYRLGEYGAKKDNNLSEYFLDRAKKNGNQLELPILKELK